LILDTRKQSPSQSNYKKKNAKLMAFNLKNGSRKLTIMAKVSMKIDNNQDKMRIEEIFDLLFVRFVEVW